MAKNQRKKRVASPEPMPASLPPPEPERAGASFLAPRGAEAYTPLPTGEPKAKSSWKPWLAALLGAFALAAVVSMTSKKVPEFGISSNDIDVAATQSARELLKAGKVPRGFEGFPREIQRQIASGERSLYSFRVIDTVEEDGDVVKISLDGNAIGLVRLGHAGTRFTLPLKNGDATRLEVQAHQDGGGGVTFGAASSVGQVVGDVMEVGQTRSWMLRFK